MYIVFHNYAIESLEHLTCIREALEQKCLSEIQYDDLKVSSTSRLENASSAPVVEWNGYNLDSIVTWLKSMHTEHMPHNDYDDDNISYSSYLRKIR